MEDLKLVIVGDANVGKTYLLTAYVREQFAKSCIATVFEQFSASEMFGDQRVNLKIADTSGVDDYDRLRPLQYPGAGIILLCFSAKWQISFRNISQKWLPEVRTHCPDTPILLVATKTDERDESPSSVTTEEGERLARELKASYVETSAKTMEGVKECFQKAVEVALTKSEPKKKRRGILSWHGIPKTIRRRKYRVTRPPSAV